MSGRGRGGGRGRGAGRGRGGDRGRDGQDGLGRPGKERCSNNNGSDVREFEDEFDMVQARRQVKGEEEDDYDAGATGGQDVEGDDDEEDDERKVRRMTKQFAWEEERMEEEFNEAGDKMEPFNLKNERTEGFFDETGNFVWKKEEGGEDAWLASLENEEDLEARIGEAAVARKKKDDEDAEGEEPPEFVDQWALKERLLTFMRPGETVLRALKRLGPSGGKEGGGEGLKRGGKAMVQKRVDVRTPEEKEAFEQVTELADQLLRAGAVEVYDVAYEAMRAGLEGGDEGRRGGRKRPAVGMSRDGGEVLWEYKGPDGLVHGPYSSETIRAWRAQGFFTGPTAVEMRRVGSGTGATMQVGEPSRKKVTFSVATLAADFEDDEEGGGQGGREAGAREGEWVGSDAIDWSAQT